MKVCRFCGQSVLFVQRSDKEYCGPRCRVGFHRQRKAMELQMKLEEEKRARNRVKALESLEEAMKVGPFPGADPGETISNLLGPLPEGELLQIEDDRLPGEDG